MAEFLYSGSSCFTGQPGNIRSQIPLTIGGVYATDNGYYSCFIVSGLSSNISGRLSIKS